MQSALIVEDKPETRNWLAAALAQAFPGICCREAATVSEALSLLEQYVDELALVDLDLPDGSGLTVLEALRPLPSMGVVITMFDDDDYLFPALRAGAQGYLLKDSPPDVMVKQLRRILDGEPPLSPAISSRLLSWFERRATAATDARLTAREQEVLVLLAKGLTLAQVAGMLSISRHTAADHVKSIYRKLSISSRAEAVAEAGRLGLIELG